MENLKDQPIKPETITKPIQILAAWLAGLLSISTCFLVAATNMPDGSWESRALVISAIGCVPLFLIAVFLLQTKFRPELQEDSYYSTYLSQKTNLPIRVNRHKYELQAIEKRLGKLEGRIKESKKEETDTLSKLQNLTFGINRHLPDKDAIRKKLGVHGITAARTFGPEKPPPHRNISISEHLDTATQDEVISLARELGFTSYNYFDNWEERAKEDVLFGSYGNADFEILQSIK